MMPSSNFKKVNPIYGMPVVGRIYKQNLEIAIKLTSPHNKKVLDIGFGFGVLFPYLSKFNAQSYGIDIHSKQAEVAKEILTMEKIEASILVGNAHDMPFKDSTFECVYMLNALEHIKDINSVLEEIKRILVPTGDYVVAVPTENFIYKVGRMILKWKKPRDHYHTAHEIEQNLQQHFQVLNRKVIYPFAPLFVVYLCKHKQNREK